MAESIVTIVVDPGGVRGNFLEPLVPSLTPATVNTKPNQTQKKKKVKLNTPFGRVLGTNSKNAPGVIQQKRYRFAETPKGEKR